MNKKAVSPVIGTMLTVTIVVILSVIVAGLTLGIVPKLKSYPQAKFILEDSSSNINLSGGDLFVATLYGGDFLICRDIKFLVIDTSNSAVYVLTWNSSLRCFVSNQNIYAYGSDLVDGTITPGDKIIFNETAMLIGPRTVVELKVIHIPSNAVIYVGRVMVK